MPDTDWQKDMLQSPIVEGLPPIGPLWYNPGQTQRTGPTDHNTAATRSGYPCDDTCSGSSTQVAQSLRSCSNATTSSDNMDFSPLGDMFSNPTPSRKTVRSEGPLPTSCGHSPTLRRDSANCCVAVGVTTQPRQQPGPQDERLPYFHAKVSHTPVVALTFHLIADIQHPQPEAYHDIRVTRRRARRSTLPIAHTFESRLEHLLREIQRTYETGVSMHHLSADPSFESAIAWIEDRVRDRVVRQSPGSKNE
jgi:hypothetical protein